MARGNLYVISGPSGVGKGLMLSTLVKMRPKTWVSVSATTRHPRPGETDGVDYIFMRHADFKKMIGKDGFLEYAEYSNNFYGTPKSPVEEHLAQGDDVVLEIDVQGAAKVRQKRTDTFLVFIEPPSMEVLEERLKGRGTENATELNHRLAIARQEFLAEKEYDRKIVNDDLMRAVSELAGYMDENRC